MKVKYRVLESRYSDGSVRFFPQNGDWWHGWRFYGKWLWSAYSARGTQAPIWFDSLEEAEAFLHKQIDWLKTFGRKTTRQTYGCVCMVKEIVHKYDKEKEVRDEPKDED
jgi:hypothetical protein